VGIADLKVVAQNYGHATNVTFAKGDFNFDGKVDFADLVMVAQKYGKSLPAPGLAAGEYTFRCRTIDNQNIAQPLPRPFKNSGHSAMETIDITVS